MPDVILLVHSSLDPAGVNIAKTILTQYNFTRTPQTYQKSPIYQATINNHPVTFITLEEETVNAQYLQTDFPKADLCVFLSRHSSQSGKPTLSVHTTGNFGDAELGGLSKTLSMAPATAMQTALKALVHYKDPLNVFQYEVSYECTHHGPSLDLPTMFVELGSSEAQWGDVKAAEAVAHSAMTAVATFTEAASPVALGIGGTHYNQKFTLMALMGQAAFGHMVPKHAVSRIDEDMLRQCIDKTSGHVCLAVLDWKGILSEDKPGLLSALEAAGLPYQKI
ncbi:MAG: D-aminoacyl-tRNA deacylase [Candidatus Bathyarchaeota archaeon]|nr:D-aminoacyl-tRNA deacylase [Candidatus Bathyarchaeota archaeon]